jgi:hypothetical protein
VLVAIRAKLNHLKRELDSQKIDANAQRKMPMADTVTLTLTIDQARSVKSALDMYVRLNMGQFQVIAEAFATGDMKVSDHSEPNGSRTADSDTLGDIRRACDDLRLLANHCNGGSFGLGNRGVSVKTHRSYEVYKVLAQALAVHNDPTPVFRHVDYDGLGTRYADGPAPSCSIAVTIKPHVSRKELG